MKEVLKYQDIDMQIKKIESDILNSKERETASKLQQYLKNCQSQLVELNSKSGEIVKKYEQLKNVYNDMTDKVQVVSKSLDITEEKKLENLSEASAAILANLKTLERELQNVLRQIEVTRAEFDKIMGLARNARRNLEVQKNAYTKLKDSKNPDINKLKSELKSQEKNVDAKLLAKYLSRHNEKNLPVFVPETKGSCGGCRMEIAARTIEKLKLAKYLECENCGRVIYSE